MGRPVALVSAASGIGDILRITPLIRVFERLGYQVDVLLAPDYLEVVTLLEGAPEIHHLFYLPSPWCSDRQQCLDGLSQEVYDIATFTIWSLPLQRFVRTRQILAFDQSQWLREGDIACVEKIARAVGWDGPLPAPFTIPSNRHFALPSGTIALHPGCKPGWPWKKWHGFEELARLIPQVVIIGTTSDLENENTYFGRAFRWPDHAMSFIGILSLPDTAALLRECAALVSNDSGMMQLGVAMDIPTFGIFGITSPHREAIPARNMFPITKGLPCEPACRRRPWGRRDCEHHLQCLKSLTAEEIFSRLTEIVPQSLSAVTFRATRL
jgi:ADP-heptose:LPS heptosyltransferase